MTLSGDLQAMRGLYNTTVAERDRIAHDPLSSQLAKLQRLEALNEANGRQADLMIARAWGAVIVAADGGYTVDKRRSSAWAELEALQRREAAALAAAENTLPPSGAVIRAGALIARPGLPDEFMRLYAESGADVRAVCQDRARELPGGPEWVSVHTQLEADRRARFEGDPELQAVRAAIAAHMQAMLEAYNLAKALMSLFGQRSGGMFGDQRSPLIPVSITRKLAPNPAGGWPIEQLTISLDENSWGVKAPDQTWRGALETAAAVGERQ